MLIKDHEELSKPVLIDRAMKIEMKQLPNLFCLQDIFCHVHRTKSYQRFQALRCAFALYPHRAPSGPANPLMRSK